MKRILSVVALIAATMVMTVTAGAKPLPLANVYVDGAGSCGLQLPCYSTIQQGIDNAAVGDVVFVYPGTYHEHVSVWQAVTVRGAAKSLVTIDGDGSGPVLAFVTNGATVSQLSVTDAGSGNAVEFLSAGENQLSKLRVSGASRGLFFRFGSGGNVVTDTEVFGTTDYGVDVGDTGNSGNQFTHMKIHDNAGLGFIGYSGSNGTLLSDSDVSHNGGTGVQIGWSGSWTVQNTHIHHNAFTGLVTDTVWSGTVSNNHIDHNGASGMNEAGFISTVTTQNNHIDHNGANGIAFSSGAQNNVVQNNVVDGNNLYAIYIPNHPYCNCGNLITGNRLDGPNGSSGDAFDDQTSGAANTWSSNFYRLNKPYVAPYTIPGAAGSQDLTPRTK